MHRVKSIEELYNRVLPALKATLTSLKLQGYVSLTYNDIWNYLLETKWLLSNKIELSDIVDDIMCVDGHNICEFKKNKNQEEL